ncbi:prepilin/preflagellin peptidase [Natronomonas pharaonis DSM 2160]|uniref:Prepilin/preflagellin peptidase n=1 Tax=Natronomonas pharaonis (strain ATCC 35678 / DSM 2160 / CIP 103997 / JCM 8858 / NBRC 14720 / NCIMB 2260 / Gabara) TaxID=348780 RepID=A0A1U7EUR1_NATPD|nr:A24 family peptidase [Natronomonas pharaonis]CAI48729.2 prepilin/preflagellin peptidase [Natronomonas pharaonis DSM 2160]
MSSLLFGTATGPDLLRLAAVPAFAWAAYRDIETRRIPNRTWLPLLAVGIIALLWDTVAVTGFVTPTEVPTFERRRFVVQTLLSVGFVAPLGYIFWRIGGFGGADAKAIITLAVAFPVYPTYYVFQSAYPLYEAPLGVFSFTILSNAVVVGLAYPLVLAVRNLPRGEITPAMFIGRPVSVSAVTTEYGRLLETPDGFTRGGLDIDALRMYLQWRGSDLESLRAAPDDHRRTVPTDPNRPGDGAIDEWDTSPETGGSVAAADDPWGAEMFLDAHDAYGTTPEQLREGLAVLADAETEQVWISPGIPFIVPMFVGLVVAVTYGDVLFAVLDAFGLA